MNKFFLIQTLIILIVIAAFCWILLTPGPGLEQYQQAAHPHYELTDHYTMYEQLNCLYETLPQYEYDFCVKEFTQTKNHGMVPTLSTCPTGGI